MDKHSVNNIAKLLSITGLALGVFLLLPVGVGIYYGESVWKFGVFVGCFLGLHGALFLTVRAHIFTLSLKEGILGVNLIWLLAGIAGGVPLWLYGDIRPMQAFFEAISGFTTTGATVFTDIEALPYSLLMLRSLMQWLGGMGILVLGVGLFSLINPSGSLALFKAEANGVKLEKITPKIKDTALVLWGIYFGLTCLNTLLLYLQGFGFFDALNHAFCTLSTGGFSTKNSSFGAFSDTPLALWTTTCFMLLGGINFLAHFKLLQGSTEGYRYDETRWYGVIFFFLAFILTIIGITSAELSFFEASTHAFFNIASLLTTTGFASVDYETWGQLAVAVCFIAMLIGGNGGSTSGGVKVVRFIIISKVVFAEIKKIIHPNAIFGVFMNKNLLSPSLVTATFGFMMLFILTNALIVIFLFGSGYDALTSISAAIACVGNVGPGFGLVGPAQHYGFFTDTEAFVLALGMIAGRLEIYTFFLVFFSGFWRRF
ncbi:TrkH family potassium uptake protein [Sulfurospirillum sp. T05]|uniref:TrkH family potassium uptake protein n=1 Tax=Sulfurospirillum tamanense TaxID=2813362 RepID=A0ABS2WQ15_9BACT|nr:TrkH family potassium uptake protein [Sulfurospirillum tamanensis]MBN2963723.1 TrkH family potassium uptake protein [Sulfurospirillum tamanensis]